MIDESLLKSAVAGKDGFTWWIGRVAHSDVWFNANRALASKGGMSHRCKVRIIGYHPWDATELAEEDLPWAHVMMDPVTGSGQGGLGDTQALTGGETAIGFFLDGDEAQQPVIMGLLHRSADVANSIGEGDAAKSSQFQPFTGHPKKIRQSVPDTKREIVDTATVKKNSDPDKGKILKISDSNRAVFRTLSEGQISRILDGSSTEVNVTTDLQSQLRAWIVERDHAGEQSALGNEVTGGGDGSGESSTDLKKQSASAAGIENKTTKVHEPPDPCNNTAIGQLTHCLLYTSPSPRDS